MRFKESLRTLAEARHRAPGQLLGAAMLQRIYAFNHEQPAALSRAPRVAERHRMQRPKSHLTHSTVPLPTEHPGS